MITPCSEIIYVSGKNEIDAKESLLAAMFTEFNDKAGVDFVVMRFITMMKKLITQKMTDLTHLIIIIHHDQLVGISMVVLLSCCSVPLRQRANDYRLCVQWNT
jgi:hypothetical protein